LEYETIVEHEPSKVLPFFVGKTLDAKTLIKYPTFDDNLYADRGHGKNQKNIRTTMTKLHGFKGVSLSDPSEYEDKLSRIRSALKKLKTLKT